MRVEIISPSADLTEVNALTSQHTDSTGVTADDISQQFTPVYSRLPPFTPDMHSVRFHQHMYSFGIDLS